MARELGVTQLFIYPKTGSPERISWITNFETKNNYKEREYKADMQIEKSSKMLETIDVKMDCSSNLPPKMEVKLTGAKYIKGTKITTTTTLGEEIGIGYEILMDDGTHRRRYLPKITLSKEEQKNDVDSEGEVFSFSGKAIPDENGNIEMTMDEKEVKELNSDSAVKTAWDSFFTQKPSIPTA